MGPVGSGGREGGGGRPPNLMCGILHDGGWGEGINKEPVGGLWRSQLRMRSLLSCVMVFATPPPGGAGTNGKLSRALSDQIWQVTISRGNDGPPLLPLRDAVAPRTRTRGVLPRLLGRGPGGSAVGPSWGGDPRGRRNIGRHGEGGREGEVSAWDARPSVSWHHGTGPLV